MSSSTTYPSPGSQHLSQCPSCLPISPTTSLCPVTPSLNATPPARTWPFSPAVATFPLPPAPADTATRTHATRLPYLALSKGSHGAAALRLLAPPLSPSRRRHLLALGREDCAELARGAGGGCCGAGAGEPPPLPPFALGSEGAPGRPAPAGHVVLPPPPAAVPGAPPRSPRPPSPVGPRHLVRALGRPARPIPPLALPPRCQAPLPLCRSGPERGRHRSEHLQPGGARHPRFGTWNPVGRRCTSDGRAEKICDSSESQNGERESFSLAVPPCPLGFKSTHGSPQLPPPRETGRVPLHPDPSQANAAGLTQHLGSRSSKAAIPLGGAASEGPRVGSAAPQAKTEEAGSRGLGEPSCLGRESSLFSNSAQQPTEKEPQAT